MFLAKAAHSQIRPATVGDIATFIGKNASARALVQIK